MDQVSAAMREELRATVHSWVEQMIALEVLKPYSSHVIRSLVMGTYSRVVRESLDGNLKLNDKMLVEIEELTWSAISL